MARPLGSTGGITSSQSKLSSADGDTDDDDDDDDGCGTGVGCWVGFCEFVEVAERRAKCSASFFFFLNNKNKKQNFPKIKCCCCLLCKQLHIKHTVVLCVCVHSEN